MASPLHRTEMLDAVFYVDLYYQVLATYVTIMCIQYCTIKFK